MNKSIVSFSFKSIESIMSVSTNERVKAMAVVVETKFGLLK